METTAVPRLLTVPETAELLRVSEPTMRRLVARGDLPAVRVGAQVRIDSDELRGYLYGDGTVTRG